MASQLMQNPWIISLIVIIVIWDLIWKCLALWKSARRNQPIWFVILLLVISVGILPIIYLTIYEKKNKPPIPQKKAVKKKRKQSR